MKIEYENLYSHHKKTSFTEEYEQFLKHFQNTIKE